MTELTIEQKAFCWDYMKQDIIDVLETKEVREDLNMKGFQERILKWMTDVEEIANSENEKADTSFLRIIK